MQHFLPIHEIKEQTSETRRQEKVKEPEPLVTDAVTANKPKQTGIRKKNAV